MGRALSLLISPATMKRTQVLFWASAHARERTGRRSRQKGLTTRTTGGEANGEGLVSNGTQHAHGLGPYRPVSPPGMPTETTPRHTTSKLQKSKGKVLKNQLGALLASKNKTKIYPNLRCVTLTKSKGEEHEAVMGNHRGALI